MTFFCHFRVPCPFSTMPVLSSTVPPHRVLVRSTLDAGVFIRLLLLRHDDLLTFTVSILLFFSIG
jgi:hypothetical protein